MSAPLFSKSRSCDATLSCSMIPTLCERDVGERSERRSKGAIELERKLVLVGYA